MKFPTQKTARGLRRSKRDQSEANACEGKIRHEEWADAEAVVQRIILENIEAGEAQKSGGLSTYRCPYCNFWHVGHSRGPIQIQYRDHGVQPVSAAPSIPGEDANA